MIGITKVWGTFYPDVATCQESKCRTVEQVSLDEGQNVEITETELEENSSTNAHFRCTVINGRYQGWTSTWSRGDVRIISSLETLATESE